MFRTSITFTYCSPYGVDCKSALRRIKKKFAIQNAKIRIHCTIILPVVLYGCETWSLKLRVEHRLSVFLNMVLRRIFGSMRDKVTGEWRILLNELNDLHFHQILFGRSNKDE